MVEFDEHAAQEALKKATSEKQFETEQQKAQKKLILKERQKMVHNFFSKWKKFIAENNYIGIEKDSNRVPHIVGENTKTLEFWKVYNSNGFINDVWVNKASIRLKGDTLYGKTSVIYYPGSKILYARNYNNLLGIRDERKDTDQNYYLELIISAGNAWLRQQDIFGSVETLYNERAVKFSEKLYQSGVIKYNNESGHAETRSSIERVKKATEEDPYPSDAIEAIRNSTGCSMIAALAILETLRRRKAKDAESSSNLVEAVEFSKIRQNDLCPCGSGKKYKNCHGRR